MVVLSIDQRHVDIDFGKGLARFEPGETGAGNHHARPLRFAVHAGLPGGHHRLTQGRRRVPLHASLQRRQIGLVPAAAAPHINLPVTPATPRMRLTVTTWNINSVRLRIDLVAKFIKAVRPDILCLQETKCPDDRFPRKRFKRLGYEQRRAQRSEGLSRRRSCSRGCHSSASTFRASAARAIAVMSRRCSANAPGCATRSPFIISTCPPAATLPIPTSIRNSPISSPSSTRCATGRRCGRPTPSARSCSATSTWRRSSTMSGATSKCCAWCRTRRSSARSSARH